MLGEYPIVLYQIESVGLPAALMLVTVVDHNHSAAE